jgi:hypothetical protein
MGATFNTNHWEEHRFVMIFFPLTAGKKWWLYTLSGGNGFGQTSPFSYFSFFGFFFSILMYKWLFYKDQSIPNYKMLEPLQRCDEMLAIPMSSSIANTKWLHCQHNAQAPNFITEHSYMFHNSRASKPKLSVQPRETKFHGHPWVWMWPRICSLRYRSTPIIALCFSFS